MTSPQTYRGHTRLTMRRIHCLRSLSAVAAFVCLVSLSADATVSISLSADPIPVARGEDLNYAITIENHGPGPIADATLYVPLPAGIDQLAAEVRVEGGGWEPYPPNGLVPLAPLPVDERRGFEIRGRVELGAPGRLATTAQIVSPSGPLAEESLAVNVLPSVDAGPDLIVELGGAVHLVGCSADDGGDGIATLAWSDDGAGGAFDDSAILHPIYTPCAASGLVDLTLSVSDHDGDEASDSLRVRVNELPVVYAGDDRITRQSASVGLDDATASDADGWIVEYTWSDGGAGGRFSPSADVFHPTYAVPMVDPCGNGEIELTLTAVDDWGGEAADSLWIVVRNPNRPPCVDAGDSLTVESGATVTLDGVATDPDGVLDVVVWDQTGGTTVAITGSSATVEFVAPEVDVVEELRFQLRAVDGCGVVATDEMTVTVEPVPTFGGELRLAVSIAAFDSWGLPLSPLDVLSGGDEVRLVVEVRNVGDGRLVDLQGWTGMGEDLVFGKVELGPWEAARAEFFHCIEPGTLDERVELGVEVSASGPKGERIVADDSIVLAVREPVEALSLEKRVDAAEAAVGETIVYTYAIRNVGGSNVSGIALVDDRLGSISLPRTTLASGESLTVAVEYIVSESDVPGPLVNTAQLTGFGVSGVRTQVDSVASVAVVTAGEGGAGGSSAAPTDGRFRSVVISEVAWGGTSHDAADEWIELVNLTDRPIDLGGWSLRWRGSSSGGLWRSIDLAGTIDPLPVPLTDSVDELGRLASVREDEGWRVFDLSWWNVGKRDGDGRGFYVLERGSDETIADLAADLVYGADETFALPDDGTTLYLHAPDGTLVDTANASSASGWSAGDGRSGATMERVNLLRADEIGNWQTNPGILTNGRDAAGSRLVATAGRPNSPSLETLTVYAASKVPAIRVDAATEVPIPLDGSIRVTVAEAGEPSGGGGSSVAGPIVTRRTENATWFVFDPERWPAGTVCVWVVCAESTYLIPLVRGD